MAVAATFTTTTDALLTFQACPRAWAEEHLWHRAPSHSGHEIAACVRASMHELLGGPRGAHADAALIRECVEHHWANTAADNETAGRSLALRAVQGLIEDWGDVQPTVTDSPYELHRHGVRVLGVFDRLDARLDDDGWHLTTYDFAGVPPFRYPHQHLAVQVAVLAFTDRERELPASVSLVHPFTRTAATWTPTPDALQRLEAPVAQLLHTLATTAFYRPRPQRIRCALCVARATCLIGHDERQR